MAVTSTTQLTLYESDLELPHLDSENYDTNKKKEKIGEVQLRNTREKPG